MNYVVAVVVMVLTLGVAACGGTGDDSPQASQANICGAIRGVRADVNQIRRSASSDNRDTLAKTAAATNDDIGNLSRSVDNRGKQDVEDLNQAFEGLSPNLTEEELNRLGGVGLTESLAGGLAAMEGALGALTNDYQCGNAS